MSEFTISSYGDAGDICAAMPIARQLGSADILVSDNPLCKKIVERIPLLKPLLESQYYIGRFDARNGESITHDVAPWREGGVPFGWNLCRLHANWIGMEVDESPWLKVTPNKKYKDAIVINRSTRHHSDLFNWTPIIQHYLPDIVFIGTNDEHIQLMNETGLKFPRVITKDFLQAAEIIAASKLFVGNQSCCLNLAIGLGKRYICEPSLTSVDTVYKRDCLYVLDGEIRDFKVKGYPPLNTKSNIPEREIPWLDSPPGSLWKMTSMDGVEFEDYLGDDLLKKVNRHEGHLGLPLSTKTDLIVQMQKRFPTWGGGSYSNWMHERIAAIKKLIAEKQNE